MAVCLERVVYCSHARTPNPDALVNLIQILAVSQRNNARDGITGALAVSRGRYFQVIEGDRAAVERLLKRIQGDPRHERVMIVEHAPAERRLFGDWSMVAPTINPALAQQIDRAVNECHVATAEAVELLLNVVRSQASSGDLVPV